MCIRDRPLFDQFLDWGNGLLWGSVLIYLLVGAGIFFTLRTGAAQLRLLGHAWKTTLGSRSTGRTADGGDSSGVTSFQAFATGLASRVGTGNIAGVAIDFAGRPGSRVLDVDDRIAGHEHRADRGHARAGVQGARP